MREQNRRSGIRAAVGLLACLGLLALGLGCSEDDCLNCVQEPPVAPTMVYSVNGDQRVTVYWNDYPEYYTDRLEGYDIWRRLYDEDDELDPARLFEFLDHVPVGRNYNASRGQYHYDDTTVQNAVDYEYAVSSVARSGESYLSFELVIATPLPMSESPLSVHSVDGALPQLSGFDFSLAAEHGAGAGHGGAGGIVDPTVAGTTADILVRFDDQGVPWLQTLRPAEVLVQDAGTFLDERGRLHFDGVDQAPAGGYSLSGVLELIAGHIYIIEIANEPVTGRLHYAKLGVTHVDAAQRSVGFLWAYQLVNGLPVLALPDRHEAVAEDPLLIRM